MNFRFFNRTRNQIITKKESKTAPTLLETLTEGDKDLYDALGHYLLVDPKKQIPLLGTAESHFENGLKCMEDGKRSSARWEFELAARIKISSLDIEKAKEYLTFASSVSDSPEQMIYHATILSHLDKVKDIATQYYGGEKYIDRREKIPIKVVAR